MLKLLTFFSSFTSRLFSGACVIIVSVSKPNSSNIFILSVLFALFIKIKSLIFINERLPLCMSKNIQIKLLISDAKIPQKQHSSDIGYDLSSIEEVKLPSKEVTLVHSGISISLPEGIAGFVLPRSGLATRHQITLINSPGLIDPGYTGELLVPLINHSNSDYLIDKHDRIAQLVLLSEEHVSFEVVDVLDDSKRSDKGFGSTG